MAANPPEPLFRKIDSLQIPVPDLEAGLEFYRDRLGHPLIWRTATAAIVAAGGRVVVAPFVISRSGAARSWRTPGATPWWLLDNRSGALKTDEQGNVLTDP